MPLGDIVGGAFEGAMRFVGRCLVEIVLELLVKGVGHALIRTLRPRADPSDAACGIVGLAFWTAAVATAIIVHDRLFTA